MKNETMIFPTISYYQLDVPLVQNIYPQGVQYIEYTLQGVHYIEYTLALRALYRTILIYMRTAG